MPNRRTGSFGVERLTVCAVGLLAIACSLDRTPTLGEASTDGAGGTAGAHMPPDASTADAGLAGQGAAGVGAAGMHGMGMAGTGMAGMGEAGMAAAGMGAPPQAGEDGGLDAGMAGSTGMEPHDSGVAGGGAPDAGSPRDPDAGTGDAGAPDGGAGSGAGPDAGAPDAGSPDAGGGGGSGGSGDPGGHLPCGPVRCTTTQPYCCVSDVPGYPDLASDDAFSCRSSLWSGSCDQRYACTRDADCDAGDVCCGTRGATGLSFTCTSNCTMIQSPLRCRGPADCPGQQVCCGTLDGRGEDYTDVTCRASCDDDEQRIFCEIDADCESPATCRESTLLAGFKACRGPGQ